MCNMPINIYKYISRINEHGIIESRDRQASGCCSGFLTSGSITTLYKPFWARVPKVSKRRYIDNVITDKDTNVSEVLRHRRCTQLLRR